MKKNRKKLRFYTLLALLTLVAFSFFILGYKGRQSVRTQASSIQPILGGQPAGTGEFPFNIIFYTKYLAKIDSVKLTYDLKGSNFCGGTLIHSKWVLTAAHCIDLFGSNYKDIGVAIGLNQLAGSFKNITDFKNTFFNVISATRNENYKSFPYNYDIGLVLIDDTRKGQMVYLPNPKNSSDTALYKIGNDITSIGYGFIRLLVTPSPGTYIDPVSAINYPYAKVLQKITWKISAKPTGFIDYQNNIVLGDVANSFNSSLTAKDSGSATLRKSSYFSSKYTLIGVNIFGRIAPYGLRTSEAIKVINFYSWITSYIPELK